MSIVLVIEDMPVPRVLAGIVVEARDGGSHFARINAYGILVVRVSCDRHNGRRKLGAAIRARTLVLGQQLLRDWS
jgi:hypothetical protein